MKNEINECKGFTEMSKCFMSYDSLSFTGKIKFWVKYPRALCRYTYFMYFRDDIKKMLTERKLAETEDKGDN